MASPRTSTAFETTACSRCDGSGEYSWNQLDGSKCYGCNGSGEMLTKRGAAAKKFFQDSLSVREADLEPGMLVREIESADGAQVTSPKIRIASIERTDTRITMKTPNGNTHTHSTGGLYFRVPTAELRDEKLAAALAFQATITEA